jgi:hypothetical protein
MPIWYWSSNHHLVTSNTTPRHHWNITNTASDTSPTPHSDTTEATHRHQVIYCLKTINTNVQNAQTPLKNNQWREAPRYDRTPWRHQRGTTSISTPIKIQKTARTESQGVGGSLAADDTNGQSVQLVQLQLGGSIFRIDVPRKNTQDYGKLAHFAYRHKLVQSHRFDTTRSTWGELRPTRPQIRGNFDPLQLGHKLNPSGSNFGTIWAPNELNTGDIPGPIQHRQCSASKGL